MIPNPRLQKVYYCANMLLREILAVAGRFHAGYPGGNVESASGKKKTRFGFSLVELIIAVAVIEVIAEFEAPALLSSKKGANEASAIASLRTIHGAMVVYAKRFHGAGTFEDLARMDLLDEELGSGTKSGYTFEVVIDDSKKDSGIIASPTSWGSTGDKRYKINWEGRITFTTSEDDLSVSQARPLGSGSN